MARVIASFIVLLAVLACGKERTESNADETEMIEAYLKENLQGATKTDSGMYYLTEKEGDGDFPNRGDYVTVSYVGKFFDGDVFDQNDTFSFRVGEGRVIKGWDEALRLMKIGQKATFMIPSELAYGERGAGGAIPGNTPLIFEIELFKIEK